jgi:biopolymer transport protein ExbD
MLRILVNEAGQVLVDDEPSAISQIRAEVVRHVTNFGEHPNYSESPDQAVVSIKTDRQTPYVSYIDTLDEVWMGTTRSGITRPGRWASRTIVHTAIS